MAAKDVDSYIAGLAGWQHDAATRLRASIMEAVPGLRESIKWAEPVYELGGPLCYFRAHANHVTLGFWRGREIDPAGALLESSGSVMAHRKIRSADEIDPQLVARLVRLGAELNRAKGDPTNGAPKNPRRT